MPIMVNDFRQVLALVGVTMADWELADIIASCDTARRGLPNLNINHTILTLILIMLILTILITRTTLVQVIQYRS